MITKILLKNKDGKTAPFVYEHTCNNEKEAIATALQLNPNCKVCRTWTGEKGQHTLKYAKGSDSAFVKQILAKKATDDDRSIS